MKWLSLFLMLASCAVQPAMAQSYCVDTAIVLVADISQSMGEDERKVQRKGYADAFKHPDVASIADCGRLQVAYVEYATKPYLVVPFTTLTSTADSVRLGDAILNAPHPDTSKDGQMTGISSAMLLAEELFSKVHAERYVLDVSSDGPDNVNDGPNNIGQSTSVIRDRLTTPTPENGWREVNINGLIVGPPAVYTWSIEDLLSYYEDNIVGGPTHFTIKALRPEFIPEIVRKKLILEMV